MREAAKTISVAMCTFNGEQYLGAQLESIAAQTRIPDELVVCDDCSTDGTADVLNGFASAVNFPVRFETNPERLGSTRNFGKAISLCRGSLIALADQDDVWLPRKLETIEAEFRQPQIGLVFSDAHLIDAHDQQADRRLWEQIGLPRAERARVLSGHGLSDLLRGATVTGATMAFRANYRKLILPVPDNLPVIHDAWIALILSCVAAVRPVDQPLMLYRQHSQQQVGPQERTNTVGGMAALIAGETREAALRENPYRATLALARAAQARLAEAGDEFDAGPARAKLDSLIKHFEARSDLPASFGSRLLRVAEELMTLRYFEFSHGISSAAKDLLVTRPHGTR